MIGMRRVRMQYVHPIGYNFTSMLTASAAAALAIALVILTTTQQPFATRGQLGMGLGVGPYLRTLIQKLLYGPQALGYGASKWLLELGRAGIWSAIRQTSSHSHERQAGQACACMRFQQRLPLAFISRSPISS